MSGTADTELVIRDKVFVFSRAIPWTVWSSRSVISQTTSNLLLQRVSKWEDFDVELNIFYLPLMWRLFHVSPCWENCAIWFFVAFFNHFEEPFACYSENVFRHIWKVYDKQYLNRWTAMWKLQNTLNEYRTMPFQVWGVLLTGLTWYETTGKTQRRISSTNRAYPNRLIWSLKHS